MNTYEKKIRAQMATAATKLALVKSNLAFARASNPQKRVMIAADVIAMLALPPAKRPNVTQGMYCEIAVPQVKNGDSTDLQDLVTTNPSACTVCGIGAMFLGHVRKMDGIRAESGRDYRQDDYDIIRLLQDYFPVEMLYEIECAFEQGQVCSVDKHESYSNCDLGRAWGRAYPTPTTRLRAICRNIIRNKGTFKPGDPKDVKK